MIYKFVSFDSKTCSSIAIDSIADSQACSCIVGKRSIHLHCSSNSKTIVPRDATYPEGLPNVANHISR